MARSFAVAVVGACVLLGSTLLVVPPAQAQWTKVGHGTHFAICRHAARHGDAWGFRARVGKPDGVPDVRAGIELWRRDHRRDRWRSGWVGDSEVRRGQARIRKAKRVRVVTWREAGDRDSPTGTSLQARVYRPRHVKHC